VAVSCGRRHKQLQDDLTGNREYWKLKDNALDHSVCGEFAL